jgi:hypothetical protein
MKRTLLVLSALLVVPKLATAQSVWVAPESVKVRPGDRPGTQKAAVIEAARNEFEAFHVVLDGGASGLAGATVTTSALTGPGGATIDGGDIRIYREGWYNVSTPSSVVGATGRWPDIMIPAVDEVANEPRNAFPVDVPAGSQQPVYVEVHVAADAAPGVYTGTVHVTAKGFTADVPVTLGVHGFTLPSTSSLRTAFGMFWSGACIAHFGSFEACGQDEGTARMIQLYTRFALDHRITIDQSVYTGPTRLPQGGFDWPSWDAIYAPLLDGTGGTRLKGAKLTSVRFAWTRDAASYKEWASHFKQKGWFDRTFDYTCDEPPAACSWSGLADTANTAHAGDPAFRTLSTTTIDKAKANGVDSVLDTLVPIINELNPIDASNTRPEYDAWLAGAPARRQIWSYQSCMSDGCNIVGQETGWPSYMIDAPALYNRAMEWHSWRNRVEGELYYETMYAFTRGDAWTNQYYFGGNGDGTLFYPGTPAKIGGKTDVPIASFRMKMIRAGLEDYEYLKALADAGDPKMADDEAAKLAPAGNQFTTDPAALDAARHRIAARIDELKGYSAPGVSTMPAPDGSTSGSPGGSAASPASDPSAPHAGGCSFVASDHHPGLFGVLASLAVALVFVIRRTRVRR